MKAFANYSPETTKTAVIVYANFFSQLLTFQIIYILPNDFAKKRFFWKIFANQMKLLAPPDFESES